MAKKLTINCATGQVEEVEMTGAELAAHEACTAAARASDADARTAAQKMASLRASVLSDLQSIRDAGSLAALKAPLLRTLVFILRRLGERDA